MQWSDFHGHARQKEWFSQAIRHRRLASTFLMVGPEGCGKRTFARLLAKSLLCPYRSPTSVDPCGRCESCVQVDEQTHPDLLQVSKPPDASSLSIDILVGPKENRLREGLCYELHMKPFHGVRRIAIIDDADTILAEAANSMLKTLEEPPPGAMIFLIASNEQRQLSTIRSRSQIVRFQGLSPEDIAQLLVLNGWVNDYSQGASIARLADGLLIKARALLDEDFHAIRSELIAKLDTQPLDFVGLSKMILANVQKVGEEGTLRRSRLKSIFDVAIDFYRASLAEEAKLPSTIKPQRLLPLSTANRALEACLAAQSDIERYLTHATLLESWATELAEICYAS